MSGSTLNEILSVLGIILGGGATPLILFLLRRRPELRQVASETASNYSTITDKLITQLQSDGLNYRGITKELQEEVGILRQRQEQGQKDFANQLRDAHEENTRLTTQVARLQTDLDIARRQIRELTDRYPIDPTPREAS